MIKAAAGGGGRGIRRVDDADELAAAFAARARRGAAGVRRRHACFMERLVDAARATSRCS